ncbi:MAG: TIGR01777 family oxidoreductase [Bryobacteraceae bacterium]
MKIALTGASGFLGRALAPKLIAAGHSVERVNLRVSAALPPVDAVVHLAGEPVAQRWTAPAKRRILESRAQLTRELVESMARLSPQPGTLISASAIGIYGSPGDRILTEDSPPGTGFLADVCVVWERAAAVANALGIRVVNLRTGVVLGHGGALAQMLPAFRWGAGGRLGSGRQWMSWIHILDWAALVEFALRESRLHGPLNATAPNPVRNSELTRTLASILHRPAFAALPASVLKLLLGEMAGVLLSSQRVLPKAAQAAGFQFLYPDLGPALRHLLGRAGFSAQPPSLLHCI